VEQLISYGGVGYLEYKIDLAIENICPPCIRVDTITHVKSPLPESVTSSSLFKIVALPHQGFATHQTQTFYVAIRKYWEKMPSKQILLLPKCNLSA
jgi:hypothetical protein